MALQLTIIKSPAGLPLAETEKTFGEQGGALGRGEGNDWVLNDPDRFLSSKHCVLSCEGAQYYLTDTSTNGTFINGAPEPLGKGRKIPVNDGDSIELGDYQFRAEVQMDLPAMDDPFGGPIEAPAAHPFDLNDDPFSAPTPAPLPASPIAATPFGADPFAVGNSDLPLSSDPLEVDPLAALDKKSAPAGDQANKQVPTDFDLNPIEDDYFFQPEQKKDFADFGTQGESGDALNQSVAWPDSKSESAIPEDWDDELMGAPSPPQPAPVPRAPRPRVTPEHRSMPLTDPPKSPARPREGENLLAERKPEKMESFRSREPAPKPQPRSRQPARSKRSATQAQMVGDALLDGLGLSGQDLTQEETEDIHAAIGELMPVVIGGMMQVLRSRASIKNEFRMNVTTIQPVENNPLKFSATAQEAIENMFLRRSSAYMGANQAFKEGFDGVGEHQVAIIAGIRAAFKSMMDRFNPELLERQFDKHNKGVVLPGLLKTKYWNSYSDYYEGFIDNMENSFQYLFGDEFVQAYEDQLRRLAVERKQRQKFDE